MLDPTMYVTENPLPQHVCGVGPSENVLFKMIQLKNIFKYLYGQNCLPTYVWTEPYGTRYWSPLVCTAFCHLWSRPKVFVLGRVGSSATRCYYE